MKKSIILITLTFLISNINAQVTQEKETQKPKTNIELGQFYMQKGKKQIKTAWILLGSGIVLYGATLLIGSAEYDSDGSGGIAIATFFLGSGAIIASIPVFIAGGKNKARAEILLRDSNIPISFNASKNIPVKSVGIVIPIGR